MKDLRTGASDSVHQFYLVETGDLESRDTGKRQRGCMCVCVFVIVAVYICCCC